MQTLLLDMFNHVVLVVKKPEDAGFTPNTRLATDRLLGYLKVWGNVAEVQSYCIKLQERLNENQCRVSIAINGKHMGFATALWCHN